MDSFGRLKFVLCELTNQLSEGVIFGMGSPSKSPTRDLYASLKRDLEVINIYFEIIQDITSLRKEKKSAKQKLTIMSEEARELNDKLENLRVMPVKDKEITTLESNPILIVEKIDQLKTKITLMKPEYDNLVNKINQKWGILTGNIAVDLKNTCDNESVKISKYDKLLQNVNHLFIETLSNHTKVFSPLSEAKSPTVELDIEVIKRRNEFARRFITGFPISWLNTTIEEKNFKGLIEKLLNKDISSPFYDM